MEDYHDRLWITTPEGIEFEIELAGVGSRFIATVVDLVLKALLILLSALALVGAGGWGRAVMIAFSFAVYFGYDIAFERLGRGQTPGKRVMGLRVLRLSGAPVDLPATALRNIFRVIDGLPLLYLPAIFSVILTGRNQRIGDLAAGTVVARDARSRENKRSQQPGPAPYATRGAAAPTLEAGWDVSAIGPEEIATVRSFLERRHALDLAARLHLAQQLADALSPRVGGAPDLPPEPFLEQLALLKHGHLARSDEPHP